MSTLRLFLVSCLVLFAGAAAAVVLLPVVPAAALNWHLPEPPFGALLFALGCALVLMPGRTSAPRPRTEPFSD